jgi:hypothetical protein
MVQGIAAPAPRFGHTLVYDVNRGRSVLFGGMVGNLAVGDTWEFDGSLWAPVQTNANPIPCIGAASAFDVIRGKPVVVGGYIPSGISMRNLSDTWCLSPPQQPTWTRHGIGCPGSFGVPSMDRISGSPALGTAFPLRLSMLPAQAGLAYLAFGVDVSRWNGASLPFDLTVFGVSGCKLWVDISAGTLLGHAGIGLTYTLTIPSDPWLAGCVVASQALVFDQTAPNGIGAVSNAGVIRLY